MGVICYKVNNMKQYLELGKINNTHGLRGELKFEYWCDGVDYLKQLDRVYLDDEGKTELRLISVRPQKNIAIIKLESIDTIEKAEELKHKLLYCNRDDVQLDEDSFYLADLIGCSVVDAASGKGYGTVKDIMNYGSCDIYDVVKDKKHYLIPATPDVIEEIDTEKQLIRINALKGLFDEN